MATISLPPLKSKIRLLKPCDSKISLSDFGFLGTAKTTLEAEGYVINGSLFLDVNTEIQIDAFKAWSSNANWPLVKITIFTGKGKKAQCYIPMNDLDGISWDPVEAEVKAAPVISKRLTVDTSQCGWVYSEKEGMMIIPVWHNSFGRDGYTPKNWGRRVLINPLELEKSEIELNRFDINSSFDLGNAVFKFGKDITQYKIEVLRKITFGIEKELGLMYAKLADVQYEVRLLDTSPNIPLLVFTKNYLDSERGNITPSKIKTIITEFLKEYHEL